MGVRSDPAWPDSVTLKLVDLDLEEFKELIVGSWYASFTCNGRPLSSKEILNIDYGHYVGYKNSRKVFQYESANLVTSYRTTSILSMLRGLEYSERYFEKDSIKLSAVERNGVFISTYEAPRTSISKFAVATILETGETIILQNESDYSCKDGSPFYGILMPLATAD